MLQCHRKVRIIHHPWEKQEELSFISKICPETWALLTDGNIKTVAIGVFYLSATLG